MKFWERVKNHREVYHILKSKKGASRYSFFLGNPFAEGYDSNLAREYSFTDNPFIPTEFMPSIVPYSNIEKALQEANDRLHG